MKNTTNILNLIKEDHELVADLLKKLEDTTAYTDKTRTTLFNTFAINMRKHSKGEETVLYPKLEAIQESKDLALEAEEEHRIVAELINKLEAMDVKDSQWGPSFKVLKENIEHHVEEEEADMFKKIRALFEEDELSEMGQEFEQVKAQVQAPKGKESSRQNKVA